MLTNHNTYLSQFLLQPAAVKREQKRMRMKGRKMQMKKAQRI